MIRRALICAGLGTWCFLNTWVEFARGVLLYHFRYDPVVSVLPTVLILQVSLILALFLAWMIWRPTSDAAMTAAERAFLVAFLAPFGMVCSAVSRVSAFHLERVSKSSAIVPVAAVALVFYLAAVVLWPRRTGNVARELVLYSWPLLLFVYLKAGRVTLLRYSHRSYLDGTPAPRLPAPAADRPRVVWIVFDELSQSIAFDKRPVGLQLPAFDRFRAQSLYAPDATAPDGMTIRSMPSLISGFPVDGFDRNGPAGFRVRTPDMVDGFEWNTELNVFDSVRNLGFNTALLGWYHPYCRLIPSSLTECMWTPVWSGTSAEEIAPEVPLVKALATRVELQAAALPFARTVMDTGVFERREKQRLLSLMMEKAIQMSTDRSLGLVLLHLPVPHPPYIYDRQRRQVDTEALLSYIDSVAHTDQVLAEIRRAMEGSGTWDNSVVIISGDHGWRAARWRVSDLFVWTPEDERESSKESGKVPFLVKMAKQDRELLYDRPVKTLYSRALITAILKGELTTAEQVATWLSTRK